jgi:rhodanese-related sulfurtransferase
MQTVDTEEVRALLGDGAQLVEVLPETAYEQEHLPGAVSLPLAELRPDRLEVLDRDRPVITYCYDHECDLSSRAAALLSAYGFADVRDYANSKTAWLGAGLPAEGRTPTQQRAGAIAHRDVVTASFEDTVGQLAARLGEAPFAVVVDDERVVLGVVRREALGLPPTTPLPEVLQPAPPTVRPSITADELARSMDDDGQWWVLVSTSIGALVGAVYRDDLDGQR